MQNENINLQQINLILNYEVNKVLDIEIDFEYIVKLITNLITDKNNRDEILKQIKLRLKQIGKENLYVYIDKYIKKNFEYLNIDKSYSDIFSELSEFISREQELEFENLYQKYGIPEENFRDLEQYIRKIVNNPEKEEKEFRSHIKSVINDNNIKLITNDKKQNKLVVFNYFFDEIEELIKRIY